MLKWATRKQILRYAEELRESDKPNQIDSDNLNSRDMSAFKGVHSHKLNTHNDVSMKACPSKADDVSET